MSPFQTKWQKKQQLVFCPVLSIVATLRPLETAVFAMVSPGNTLYGNSLKKKIWEVSLCGVFMRCGEALISTDGRSQLFVSVIRNPYVGLLQYIDIGVITETFKNQILTFC